MDSCLNTTKNKIIKSRAITLEQITVFIIGIYLYFETVCPHTIFCQIMMVAVVALCFIEIIKFNNSGLVFYVKLNPLIVCYGLFIIYQIILCLVGKAENIQATLDDVKTMFYSFIVLLFVYSFLYRKTDLFTFEKLFVIVGVLSVLTVIYLCRDDLGSGRMAHTYKEGVSYYFFGLPIAISSNGFATSWALSIYFILNFFKRYKQRCVKCILLLAICILALGIFLTGSRKGFLLLLLCICGHFFISSKFSFSIKLILVALFCLFSYILVMNISFLYKSLGERLESLVKDILGISNSTESSMLSRDRYTMYALDAIRKNPIFGYGSGWFKYRYENVTENDYYETLVSGGIVGFIILYSYVVFAFKSFFKNRKRNKDLLRYSFLLVMILIIMWGSVVVLNRDYLIYLSMYFLCLYKQRNNISVKNINS